MAPIVPVLFEGSMRHHAALAVFVALLPACRQLDSANVETNQIKASFTAVAEGSGCGGGVTVEGSLTTVDERGSADIHLTGGENLTVSYQGDSTTMSETSVMNTTSFEAELSEEGKGGELVVAFKRSKEHASASRTVVEMPPGFKISFPKSGDDLSRAKDAVVFSWDNPSGDTMTWSADGSCIAPAEGKTPGDSTQITIPAGTFQQVSGAKSNTCEVTITVERRRKGVPDGALAKGSEITGIQRRKIHFDSEP
jgi:hypothetical protein